MAALFFAAALSSLVYAAPASPELAIVARSQGEGVSDILHALDIDVQNITINLRNASLRGKVDISVVQGYLNQLITAIANAAAKIQVVIQADILLFNGALVTIDVCAQIYLTLVLDIVALLQLCLDVVIQVDACRQIIIQVDLALKALLQIIVVVVIGIQIDIAGLLSAHVSIIASVGLCATISVLGLINIDIC